MIGRTAVAVAVIVVIASAVGAFILISNNSGSSESVVSYYDGNEKIDETRERSGSSIRLLDRTVSDERTLFGWSTLPDGAGKTYGPGSQMTVEGDVRLYAMAADGIITVIGSSASFIPAAGGYTDPVLIDLGYAKGVTAVTIGSDTMELLKAYRPSLRIEYYDGLGLTLDPTAVDYGTHHGDLSIGYSIGRTETTDIKIRSGGSDTPDRGGRVTATVDAGHLSQSTVKIFLVGSDGTEVETSYSESNGRLRFDLDGFLSFRAVELFGISAIHGSSDAVVDLWSDEVGITPVYSGYFQKYGMFATGDVFRLSPTAKGIQLTVSGAARSVSGDYVVFGNSPILIKITERTDGTFSIILPEEQIGFTLTSDPDSVPFGGRCIIAYKLSRGYVDEELTIAVNGNIIAPNGLGEIHLSDIAEDQYVTVTGVYDFRVYDINVPEKQIGYTLTTSVDRLHHGQSYTVSFALDPGYAKGPLFKVRILNGADLDVSNGKVTVSDVKGDHLIIVEGVEIISYHLTAGKNTVLRVNGQTSSVATAFDLVTIEAAFGYILPPTFEDMFPNTVKKVTEGYNVSGDVVFPSVVKITVGENLTANEYSAGRSFIICTGDPVTVSAAPGYSLPINYGSRLTGASGKSLPGGKYTFSEDTKLPSVFRVIYMGYDSELARYYVADGDNSPIPPSNPIRKAYNFDGWDYEETVYKTTIISAIWSAATYNVTFGNNLIYTVNGNMYQVSGSYRLTVEDTISIVGFPPYELPADYFHHNSVVNDDEGYYHIIDNNHFETIHRITYISGTFVFTSFLTESSAHFIVDPVDQIDPPFTLAPPTGKSISNFGGWLESGTNSQYGGGQQIMMHKDYQFRAIWT